MWSDNETLTDLLGFQHLSETVISLINRDDLLPATIGIYGDWGSGKSSLIQIIQAQLEEYEDVIVLSFNGWLFEGYEDAKTALMGSIIEELIEHRKFLPGAREKAKKLLKRVDALKVAGGLGKIAIGMATGGLPFLVSAGLTAITKGIPDPEKLKEFIKEKPEEDSELRKSIREFRKDFNTLIDDSKIKKLVIIIDDLDRCLPDTIIETLEAIKLFLFVKNTAFILGADERLIKYAVRKRFPELPGERVEVGRDYLEKLVQFPIRIPPLGRPELETYIGLLFMLSSQLTPQQKEEARQRAMNLGSSSLTNVNFNLSTAQQLFSDQLPAALKDELGLAQRIVPLLATSMKGNPRQCKRFLNTLLIRLEMARFRKVDLQQRVLAKLMLLEYFKPESFRRLAELQAEQEGKPSQLKLMEKKAADVAIDVSESTLRSQELTLVKVKDNDKITKGVKSSSRATEVIEESKLPELEPEFNAWLNQNWTNEWLRLDPPLAEIDLRPYFFFSRDTLAGPLSGETQRMSSLAQEIFAGLLNDSQAVQQNALKKVADLSMADAIAVFEGLSQRAQQEEDFGPQNRAFECLFELSQGRSELRGELVALLRRLSESRVSPVVVPKILNLCKSHETESSAWDLIARWAKSSNKKLAEMAKVRLQK